MAQEDGDDETFPSFPEFKRHCAARGLDVSVRRTVGEYCQALYEAGILPSGMSMGQDRSLYASLIETTFKGGVSSQVVSRLKDYLLPEATQVSDIVTGLQTCTNEVIMTTNEIASAEKELSLLQSTYGVGKEIVLQSLRWMTESSNTLQESLQKDKADMANMNAYHQQLSEDIPHIEKEIQQAESTKETVLKTALLELREAGDKVTGLRRLDCRWNRPRATCSRLSDSVRARPSCILNWGYCPAKCLCHCSRYLTRAMGYPFIQ